MRWAKVNHCPDESGRLVSDEMSDLSRPHDRLVDRQPASPGHAEADTVLGCDISGAIEVGMKLEATGPTTEPATGAAAVAGDLPAAATCLRGMPGVNPGHHTAPFLSLVLDEGTQLGEGPGVQTAGLCPMPHLYSGPDVLEVLQHHHPTFRDGLDDLFREHVVAVATEAALLAAEFTQVALGGLGAPLLQGAAQLEPLGFDVAPAALTQEAVVAGHRRLRQAEVNPDHCITRHDFRRWNRDHNVQPPSPVAKDQIRSIHGGSRVPLGVGGQVKVDSGTSTYGRQADLSPLPVHFEGVDVETGRAGQRVRAGHWAALPLKGEGTPDSLSGLDPGLDVEVAHQGRVLGFEAAVGLVVEPDPILHAVLPAVGRDGIEDSRELPGGLCQGGGLLTAGLQQGSHSALHESSIPYVALIYKERRPTIPLPAKAGSPLGAQ